MLDRFLHFTKKEVNGKLSTGDSLVTDGERKETYSKFIVGHGINKKEIKVIQCFKKSPQPSGIN